jgi:hypothetical protein
LLENNKTFEEISVGERKILYFSLPLELADQLDAIGEIYNYAINKAGVKKIYKTSIKDPGILISPTCLKDATLYVLTSESASDSDIVFKDSLSGKTIKTVLEPDTQLFFD